MSEGRLYFLLLIFSILLQIGDGLSTYYVLVISGLGVEANPLMKYVFDEIGTFNGLVLTKASVILASIGVYYAVRNMSRMRQQLSRSSCTLVILTLLVYTVLNIHNWYMVYYIMTA